MSRVWMHEYDYEMASPPPEPVAVGDYVEWPVFPVDRDAWLERLFAGTRTAVDSIYGTHDEQATPVKQRGQVVSIEQVYSEMIETPIGIAVEVSIAEGKARRDMVKRADWRPQPEQDGLHFVGYLITLDP